VAAIVGAIDGEASVCRADATGAATASCGAQVCQAVPDEGSRQSCNVDGDCPDGEVCEDPDGQGDSCINPQAEPLLQAPNDDLRCGDCTFYATEDCCSARPGFGYVEFVERAGAEASGSAASSGSGSTGSSASASSSSAAGAGVGSSAAASLFAPALAACVGSSPPRVTST